MDAAEKRLMDLSGMDLAALRDLADVKHPQAAPVPTGGVPAPEHHLALVAEAVRTRVADLQDREGSLSVAEFDRAVGAALHETLDIVPADAASEGVWSFLSLVLLPDVAVRRFPDRHRDRLLGGPRNALRRPWWHRYVLGELLDVAERPLGEDELVGLLERTKLARRRELVRMLALRILAYPGADRSAYARQLIRSTWRHTGPRMLDVLPIGELQIIIDREDRQLTERAG